MLTKLTIPILGMAVALAVDILVALLAGGPNPRKAEGLFVVGATLAGDTAVLGLALGAAWLVLDAVFGRLRVPLPRFLAGRARGAPLALLLLAAGAVVVLLDVNADLFRGAGIRQKAWVTIAEWGFRIGGSITTFLLVLRAGLFLGAIPAAGSRRRSAVAALAALVLLVPIVVANAHLFRGQYPSQHLFLAMLAVVLGGVVAFCGAHCTRLLGRLATLRGAAVVVLGASLAGLAGLAVRVRPESAAFGTPLQRFRCWMEWAPYADRILGFANADPKEAVADAEGLREMMGGARTDDAEIAADWAGRRARGERPNILWIAVDTLRADHVSCYGYGRKTTPAIDRFAAGATLFENAWTPYPTSNFAYSAALTSLPPRLTPAYAAFAKRDWSYPDDQVLPALLAKNGYTTFAQTAFDAFTSANREWFGTLRDGFATYNPEQPEGGASAVMVADVATRFLAAHQVEPWFAWFHFMEPHAPYIRHEDFDFGSELVDHYDSDIAFTDRQVGRILDALAASGAAERTIVVLFSDHGEEFLERGGRFHNSSVHEEQIRVPLVVRVPGATARRVTSAVGLLDLLPTMLELAAVPSTAPRYGRSLLGLVDGEEDPNGGFAFAEWFDVIGAVHRAEALALREGRMKYVAKPRRRTVELYDLQADPREDTSLAGTGHPAELRLSGALQAYRDRMGTHFENAVGRRPKSESSLRDRLLALADRLPDRSPESGNVPGELRKKLFDRYLRLDFETRADLGDDGIRVVVDRIASVVPRIEPPRRYEVLDILSWIRDPRLLPFWRDLYAVSPGDKLVAAKAMAFLDDDTGREFLREVLHAGLPMLDLDLLNALARLGDAEALPWFLLNLSTSRFGRAAYDAIHSLPRLEAVLGEGVPLLRDRIINEDFRHPEQNQAIIDVLSASRHEEAQSLLLRLARNEDAEVRERAYRILKERLPPAELERRLAAVDRRKAGDEEALYGGDRWPAAIEHYRAALALGFGDDPGFLFRYARALYAVGSLDEVKRLLAPIIADDGATATDRERARRFLELGPVQAELSAMSAALEADPELPAKLAPDIAIGLRVSIRNAGEKGWRGGWYRWNARVTVTWLDEKAEVVALAPWRFERNPLPEAGVLAGETSEMLLLGFTPPTKGTFRLALAFQSGFDGSNDRVVFYRHPKLVEIR